MCRSLSRGFGGPGPTLDRPPRRRRLPVGLAAGLEQIGPAAPCSEVLATTAGPYQCTNCHRLSPAWQHAVDADHPVGSVRRCRDPDRGRCQTGSLQLPEVDRGRLCAWAVDPAFSAARPGGRLVRVPKGVFARTIDQLLFDLISTAAEMTEPSRR